MNDKKIQICEALKNQLEVDVQNLNQISQLEASKTFLQKQEKLIERKAKYISDYCK